MRILRNIEWLRKHDAAEDTIIAPKIYYPQSLKEVINICKRNRFPFNFFRQKDKFLKAAGSHWALSKAAISDDAFIETHDPRELSRTVIPEPAMGRTLYDVVPKCLTTAFMDYLEKKEQPQFVVVGKNEEVGEYLVHFETGKRVYQLYAELDYGEETDSESLAAVLKRDYDNSSYGGPWAIQTMGGAGGQTVFGALTTGTHGADFRLSPMADSVVAMHLVADGGKHYWIERGTSIFPMQVTDDAKLRAKYGSTEYGGRHNFEIIRDDNIFNAVLVSVGRFGVVYSVVLKVVRQYALFQDRYTTDWKNIKYKINDPTSDIFNDSNDGKYPEGNRSLQISLSVTPYHFGVKHLCGVTRRWITDATDEGRAERRGDVVNHYDPIIKGRRFEFAGNSHSNGSPNFLNKACARNNDIIKGALRELIEILRSPSWLITLFSAASGVITMDELRDGLTGGLRNRIVNHLETLEIDDDVRLGQILDSIREIILGPEDGHHTSVRILLWQHVMYILFKNQVKPGQGTEISYAMLDSYDYLDKGCFRPGDSIEVFFDANDPKVISYIDALLDFEKDQEERGFTFIGYISIRFTGKTDALIGMQKFERTCIIEVSGLKDVKGVQRLINYAIKLTKRPEYEGILHWGQRNPHDQRDIAIRFGNDLVKWRQALSLITKYGKLNRFSSEFTQTTGLEPNTDRPRSFNT